MVGIEHSEEANLARKVARCSLMTHNGHVRTHNEDAIAVSAVDAPNLLRWNGEIDLAQGWALVADGIGGHVAGDVASQIVIELLRPVIGSLADGRDVSLALEAANDGLFDTTARFPAFEGMGTTVAGVILRGDHALAWNVGDSRICLYHQGQLNRVSVDDVVADNMLTRCLGGFDGPARLDPHFRNIPLPPGAMLLLCTDGLTDLVAHDEIAAILHLASAKPAELLVQAALNAGGNDNVSAVVIAIPPTG